jgi:NAD(P)-dependent dehydrogenase (short-subunit alcohol dehydrogenase family)
MPSSFTSGFNALIQGSSRGIGLEFVRQLLEQAAPGRVFAAGRSPEAAAPLSALAAQHPRLRLVALDVAKDESIRSAAATVAAEVSRIHLIVNCAGMLHDREAGVSPEKRLGGWYAYRASKAAQNMFTRTLAIEWARTRRNVICVALHPGTTDTELSRPFQANVPPGKLFSTDRTVRQLLAVIERLTPGDSGRFLAWDGSGIPW